MRFCNRFLNHEILESNENRFFGRKSRGRGAGSLGGWGGGSPPALPTCGKFRQNNYGQDDCFLCVRPGRRRDRKCAESTIQLSPGQRPGICRSIKNPCPEGTPQWPASALSLTWQQISEPRNTLNTRKQILRPGAWGQKRRRLSARFGRRARDPPVRQICDFPPRAQSACNHLNHFVISLGNYPSLRSGL